MNSSKRPKNEAEGLFWDEMTKRGWIVTKRGWPDFACLKDGRMILVEVKPKDTYQLQTAQFHLMEALARAGIECYRWSANDERFEKIKPRRFPPTPPLDKDIEAEADNSLQKTLLCNVSSVTSVPTLAKIATLYEQFFGIITPVLSEKFKDFVENYRGPVGWIDLAFAEAVKYKNRRWQYVEAILYIWQEKGGPHADRREPGGERGHLGADQRDPLATFREQDWEILGGDEPEASEAGNQD